jgi:hypothetical protein
MPLAGTVTEVVAAAAPLELKIIVFRLPAAVL